MTTPFNTRATPYCIHVLQLMDHRGWTQLILKDVFICKVFRVVLQSELRK
jgi:hypothetical protein